MAGHVKFSFFTSRNERFRKIEIKTCNKYYYEDRRECLIPVNILSMVRNHCKNVLEATFRSAILLRVL